MSEPKGGPALWGTMQDLVDPGCGLCHGRGENGVGETCECVERNLEKARG